MGSQGASGTRGPGPRGLRDGGTREHTDRGRGLWGAEEPGAYGCSVVGGLGIQGYSGTGEAVLRVGSQGAGGSNKA